METFLMERQVEEMMSVEVNMSEECGVQYFFVAAHKGYFMYTVTHTATSRDITAKYVRGTHTDEDIMVYEDMLGLYHGLPVGPDIYVMTKEEFKNAKLG